MMNELVFWSFPSDFVPFAGVLIILSVRWGGKRTNGDGFDSKSVTWGLGAVSFFLYYPYYLECQFTMTMSLEI